ncbi:hypothetical protein HC928_19025 [bacterium]|nr:hypothetical protein [bacterium]
MQVSYQLLEEHLHANDHNLHAWLTLADLYLRGGRLAESLDTFQRAIELDVVSAILFVRYANLLLALDAQQWAVKDYILIDPEEVSQDRVLWEAIEAFEESLLIDPERKDVLQSQLTRLIEVGARDRFWRNFNRLVVLDHEGHMVRSVIDAMYDFEQVEDGVAALREILITQPTRVDAAVNLGALLLLVDEGEQAGRVLRQARQISDEADILADIDRLLLSADDPDFEARLADLSAVIDAGNPLSVDDVEYLEAVVENVPTFSEGYVLVSKGYLAWKEMDTALDVLLDGYQHIPNAPEIVEPLARLLWESDQDDLALDYLSRGLKAHPNDVPLLSLMGLYLFESRRDEEARTFLSRAENVAP